MADEGLQEIISIAVDDSEVQPGLTRAEQAVAGSVEKMNAALGRLGEVDLFASIIGGADKTVLSVNEVTQAVEQGMAVLQKYHEMQFAMGEGGRITAFSGVPIEEIEAQVAALRELQGTMRQGVGGGQSGMAQFTQQTREAEAEIARLQAKLLETRALQQEALRGLPPTARGTSAGGGLLPFTGGTEPGTAFLSDAEVEEGQRASRLAAAKALIEQEARSRTPMVEDLTRFRQVPIDIKEDFNALGIAMATGAAEFKGKSVIAVNEAWRGVNGAIEPGHYNARTGEPLSQMDQLYYGTRAGATAAGGGGFFGGIGRGFTSGFGGDGGGGGDALGGAGFQLGMVAQYTLYYQLFRDIESAIRESVDQALQFDRAVTDLANRLGLSRDNAQSLASTIGQMGSVAGLGPAETVKYASQYTGVFQGQADNTTLLTTGAQTAAQIQVLTGNVKNDMPDVISAVQAFNLKFGDTQRVLDAATSAAQNYGLANASSVLPGLAQIGDLAAQSGFSLEQTANAIADIQTRTNDSSQSVAGELQRFLGREGTPAFQSVFQNMGITGGSFNEELSQLSERFDKLSASQKAFITSEFGGGRAGVAALAFIEDYNRILGNTQKSLDEGGIAQHNYAQRLNDIVGVINTIRGDLKELAKDVGTSGIGSGFGIALEAVKPFVELLDEAVRLVNFLTSWGGHFTLGRDLILGASEIAAAMAVLGKLNVGERIGGIFGRGRGGADAEATPTSIAADATTGALERLTAALTETTAAVARDGAVTNADAAAKERDIAATDIDAVSKSADAAATDLDATSKLRSAITTGAGNIASLFGATGVGGLSGAGLMGAGMSLPGLIGGAILTQQFYDAGAHSFRSTRDAQTASQNAFLGPNDAASLQDEAQRLRQAAAKARAGSGGFFGSIEDYIGAGEGRLGNLPGVDNLPGVGRVLRLFGGENTETSGDVSSRARAQAGLLGIEAQRANAAQAQSATEGAFSSMIDLTKQGGVAAGLKVLQQMGLDSGQQLDALNERLASFAAAANGAANFLAKGQAALIGQNVANTAVNNLVQFASEGGAAGRYGSKDFLNNVAPGLNQVLAATAQGFLGPLQGQDVTRADQQALIKQETAAAVDYLRQHGSSANDIKDTMPQIRSAITASVQTQVAQMNASRGEKISPDAIGGVVAALPGLISGKEQEVTTAAALGQVGAPQGTSVAGIQAALVVAQNTLTSLRRSGADDTKLKAAQDAIDGVKVQLQTATLANIDAQAQLAAASIPSENQTQQIQAHIADVQAQLAATANPDDILRLTTDLRKSQQQLAASQAQDAISAIGIHDNPADSVLQASDALTKANDQVASYQARGVNGSAMNQAIGQATQAQYAYTVAVVNNANALRDANVAVGDKVGEAYAKYQDLLNTATTQVGGQRADTLRTAAAQYVTFLQAQEEQRNAIAVANIDPRNTQALDAAKTKHDLKDLGILQRDSPGDLTDIANLQAQVEQDQLAQARDRVAKLNARSTANARSGDPYAEARAQLTDANRSLSLDLAGTAQYYQDLKAVHDAEAGLARAIAERAKNVLLLRGDTTDPVATALAELAAARVQLAQDQARGTGNLQADSLAVEQAQWQAQKAAFDQQMSLQQQSYDLHHESAGQYLQFLQSQDNAIRSQLAGMKKGQEGYQQLVDELNSIDSAILGLNSQMEGQFNLGDIKVPSIYEVRRSIAESSQQVIDASTTTNTVTLNGVDISQVIAYLNSILGVTGTASRTATATRKAA